MAQGMAFANTDAVDSQDVEYTGGKNGESSTLSAGSFVFQDVTADDGITFKLAAATNLTMPLGVLMEDVPAGAYTAKILKRGNCDIAKVLGHASLAVGVALKPVSGQRYVTYSAAAAALDYAPWCVAREAYTTTSEGTKKVKLAIP
ncbi:MAG: hypothetical protein IT367_20130 [Candidatus Hydrogenedentes bacterium]|nr:hypothetical protein [Candidatus Hydrogenedentota bacterium]